jgi:hypothetical protein
VETSETQNRYDALCLDEQKQGRGDYREKNNMNLFVVTSGGIATK